MLKKIYVLISVLLVFSSSAGPQDTIILLKMLGTEVQSTAAIMQMLKIAKENVDRVKAAEAVIQKTRSVALNTDYMVFRIKSLPKRIKRLESISDLRDNMVRTRNVIKSGERYAIEDLNIDITGDKGEDATKIKEEEAYSYQDMQKKQALLMMYYDWANSGNEQLRKIGAARLAAMNAMSVNSTNAEIVRQGQERKLSLIKSQIEKLHSERRRFDRDKLLGVIPNICFEDYLKNDWSYPTVAELNQRGDSLVCKNGRS